MKKWLIVSLSLVLTAAYGLFLSFVFPIKATVPDFSEESTPATIPTDTVADIPASAPSTVETTEESAVIELTTQSDIHTLTGTHAFVYDCSADFLLYTHGDQSQSFAPASLTKLFTAQTALQYLDPAAIVTVGVEVTWIHPHSSVAWLKEGHRLTVEMLIQGMLMQSGNDAAYTLAVAAGRSIAGDADMDARSALNTFMVRMNEDILSWGLTDTHLVTPDGIDAEGHITTVADLMSISKLAMQSPIISCYAAMDKATVTFVSGESCTWSSTNWLLNPQSDYYCPAACGLKTGSTSNAGNCVVSLFYANGRYLLIGVLGCPSYGTRFADALQLYVLYR